MLECRVRSLLGPTLRSTLPRRALSGQCGSSDGCRLLGQRTCTQLPHHGLNPSGMPSARWTGECLPWSLGKGQSGCRVFSAEPPGDLDSKRWYTGEHPVRLRPSSRHALVGPGKHLALRPGRPHGYRPSGRAAVALGVGLARRSERGGAVAAGVSPTWTWGVDGVCDQASVGGRLAWRRTQAGADRDGGPDVDITPGHGSSEAPSNSAASQFRLPVTQVRHFAFSERACLTYIRKRWELFGCSDPASGGSPGAMAARAAYRYGEDIPTFDLNLEDRTLTPVPGTLTRWLNDRPLSEIHGVPGTPKLRLLGGGGGGSKGGGGRGGGGGEPSGRSVAAIRAYDHSHIQAGSGPRGDGHSGGSGIGRSAAAALGQGLGAVGEAAAMAARTAGAVGLALAQMSDASPNRGLHAKDEGNREVGNPGGGNQALGPQHGGGKNAPHANMNTKRAAREKFEAARERFKTLRQKPQKTEQDKQEVDRVEKEMNHWREKANERGETHSREPKGGRR